MFETVLITGDGEVAARVERTCKRIGIDICSAGEVEGVSGWRPDVDVLLEAAERTKPEALHPGYVSPATRTRLARAMRDAGVGFVGPSTSALEAMEDKLALRAAARRAGVRVVPGGDDVITDIEAAHTLARSLGYPVIVKPVSGTGAIGVTPAMEPADLEDALRRASEMARDTFGDARVYMEKALEVPREIEVTVVCDEHGNRTTLGERETSLQRSRAKLIAESPSPLLSQRADGDALRDALADDALRIAEEIGLTGVATFEFLLDMNCRIHFLEANADMHGAILATELLTGVDPIELQLSLAAGEPLSDEARLSPSGGHAFEVRIIADRRGQAIDAFRFPPAPHGKVRVELAVEPGLPIDSDLDPLIARIATYAPIRHQALLSLDRTLAETTVTPVGTNLTFLRRVLNHDSFRAGYYDFGFCERLFSE